MMNELILCIVNVLLHLQIGRFVANFAMSIRGSVGQWLSVSGGAIGKH